MNLLFHRYLTFVIHQFGPNKQLTVIILSKYKYISILHFYWT